MAAPSVTRSRSALPSSTRLLWWAAGLAIVSGLVYLMATASTGPVDPTEVATPESRTTIVFNSAIIVFREGLEAVLIFAAVTASFLGANKGRRRPVVLGAGVAFGAAVVTWFIAQALLGAGAGAGPRAQGVPRVIPDGRPPGRPERVR